MSCMSYVGRDVGYLDGCSVSPGMVGTEVVGYLLGAEEGLDVGRDDDGRVVG